MGEQIILNNEETITNKKCSQTVQIRLYNSLLYKSCYSSPQVIVLLSKKVWRKSI